MWCRWGVWGGELGAWRALELTERRRDGCKRQEDDVLGLENGCLLGATRLGLWTVVHVLTREDGEERAALMVGASRVVQPRTPSCFSSSISHTSFLLILQLALRSKPRLLVYAQARK